MRNWMEKERERDSKKSRAKRARFQGNRYNHRTNHERSECVCVSLMEWCYQSFMVLRSLQRKPESTSGASKRRFNENRTNHERSEVDYIPEKKKI